QGNLFDTPIDLTEPVGLRYQPDFLTHEEEATLVKTINTLPLEEMKYKNYTARRRIVSYGGQYDFSQQVLQRSDELPADFLPLRAKVAAWMGVDPQNFKQVLIAEYRPGTPLGWHRDVPDFEEIVGVSLQADAVLRFRPYPPS